MNREVYFLIHRSNHDPPSHVAIVSGTEKCFLQIYFGNNFSNHISEESVML